MPDNVNDAGLLFLSRKPMLAHDLFNDRKDSIDRQHGPACRKTLSQDLRLPLLASVELESFELFRFSEAGKFKRSRSNRRLRLPREHYRNRGQ